MRIGDKVVILRNTCNHCYDIGDIVEITGYWSNGKIYYQTNHKGHGYYICKKDVMSEREYRFSRKYFCNETII